METSKENLSNQLKTELEPLYSKLIDSVSDHDYEKAFFCMQWGRNFPLEDRHGLLFVGRATNGWDSWDYGNIDSDDVFNTIFNKRDQLQWVENLSGNRDGYNPNKSAFWRVIKRITECFHRDNWSSYIAWSNVCKVAPVSGNPSASLYYSQLTTCQMILKKEIEILSPKTVVFLTGQSWANDFLRYLNHKQNTKSILQKTWGQYTCKVYEIDDRVFILSEHPQGKTETDHTQCILDLLNNTVGHELL